MPQHVNPADEPPFDYIGGLPKFPFTTFQVENHPPIPVHSHGTYAEIVIVVGGQGQHLVGDDAFALKRGDVFVVPIGMPHGYLRCRDLVLINILYNPKVLAAVERELAHVPGYSALFRFEPKLRARHAFQSHLAITDDALEEFEEPLRRIRKELRNQSPGYEAVVKSVFASILVELARHYGSMTAPLSKDLVRLSPLLDWLEENFAQTILVETLAERAHMSRSTLERLFTKCFGTSPLNYVIELRLSKAEALLTETELSVSEVAAAVGIDNPRYLSRLFRQHLGLPPLAFRQQARRGAPPPSRRS
ncbi:MAG: AraC family transcriptional regulator [Polyangiaceae bacterium]|nr:AraC family transcriptional regulator [Polyangiaceae bacterium]